MAWGSGFSKWDPGPMGAITQTPVKMHSQGSPQNCESQVSGNEPEQETRWREGLFKGCLPAMHGHCTCELTHMRPIQEQASHNPSMGAGTHEAPPLAEELLATESC